MVISYIYKKFKENETLPTLALARIFVVLPYDDLKPVDRHELGNRIPIDAPRYLTLVGTIGKNEEWNRRERSRNHRVIPLPQTAEELESIPMLAEMFRRMDVDYRRIVNPASFSDIQQMIEGYMLEERAEGSPFIPAQEDFVEPYGVKSELGYGGFLPSGAVYTCFLFFTAPLSQAEANKLKVISAAIQQTLLPYDAEKKYWGK